MNNFPTTDQSWKTAEATPSGFDPDRLAAAVTFAETHETPWPYDLENAGDVPGLSQFERPPWNEALGPFKPRSGPNGLLLRGGCIVARWGDPSRVDMTFSIAKSYLAPTGPVQGNGISEDGGERCDFRVGSILLKNSTFSKADFSGRNRSILASHRQF